MKKSLVAKILTPLALYGALLIALLAAVDDRLFSTGDVVTTISGAAALGALAVAAVKPGRATAAWLIWLLAASFPLVLQLAAGHLLHLTDYLNCLGLWTAIYALGRYGWECTTGGGQWSDVGGRSDSHVAASPGYGANPRRAGGV